MNKIIRIYNKLDNLAESRIIFLEAENDFQLLTGVILSAQTTDRQVNSVLPVLFRKFPMPADLGAADPAEVAEIIRPVGFFKVKSANIVKTAALIQEKFSGRVPSDMDELLKLPGVGRKSANVIRGACFGLPAIIVDTHFSRTVTRLGLTTEKTPGKIESDLSAGIEPAIQYRFSMLLNKLGRDFCHARNPLCVRCPVAEFCDWKI